MAKNRSQGASRTYAHLRAAGLTPVQAYERTTGRSARRIFGAKDKGASAFVKSQGGKGQRRFR